MGNKQWFQILQIPNLVCVHFCSLRKMHNNPAINLEEIKIPIIDEYIFLDRKWSFVLHLKHLKSKCDKALQLLWVVAHTAWGAGWKTLLKLYRLQIHSQLNYDSFGYWSARKSYLKVLYKTKSYKPSKLF